MLDAIARACNSTTPSAAHLFHLAHAADGTSAGMRPRRRRRQALDTATRACNGCSTQFTAARRSSATAAWTCWPPTTSAGPCTRPSTTPQPAGTPNFARFTFLDLDAAHDFYPDWDGAADICVAILRTEAGRDPHDSDLHDLVGELATRSTDFRRRWSTHDVRTHGAGTKHFHHHDVGDLELAYESVDMISDPASPSRSTPRSPHSPTAHALGLLASWTAPTRTPVRTPTTGRSGPRRADPRSMRRSPTSHRRHARHDRVVRQKIVMLGEAGERAVDDGLGPARPHRPAGEMVGVERPWHT